MNMCFIQILCVSHTKAQKMYLLVTLISLLLFWSNKKLLTFVNFGSRNLFTTVSVTYITNIYLMSLKQSYIPYSNKLLKENLKPIEICDLLSDNKKQCTPTIQR